VQAAADFGLLLSNFRPGFIIAWLSANTSSEPTWTTTYILQQFAADRLKTYIGRRLRNAKTDCCVFNRIMTRRRAFRSKRRRRSGWRIRTDVNTISCTYIIMIYHIGTSYICVFLRCVYTCVQGDVLTRGIEFQVLMY